ncbi:hypothetical protein R3P38DRAFT_1763481 [Favolaschia claudopus]|uniref:Ricin B lectin domain-containing protein n=1 Tax=Favolaschia claudopus TaxID=2862362 RepID=A0AAW0DCR2_9AGAR
MINLLSSRSTSPNMSGKLTGFGNITDFQGYDLNLVGNGPLGEGTAVSVHPGELEYKNQRNQQWLLNPQDNGYRFRSAQDIALYISYPASRCGGNPYGAGIVASKSDAAATFKLVPVSDAPGSPVRIIEVNSGYALTSWKIVPGSRVTIAPVTLVQVDDALKLQQGWTIAWAPNS